MDLPLELFWPMAMFVAVMSLTPGPNNVVALSSGATFGLRRTMPFMTGVALGFPALLIAVAAGVGAVLAAAPWAFPAMKIAGALYLLWLAWQIAGSSSIDGGDGTAAAKPVSLVQGALFQWVNPKAWIIAVGGVATYAPADRLWPTVTVLSLQFIVICWLSLALWAWIGEMVRRVLGTPTRVRAFNVVMALLLVASLWPVLADLWQ